MIEEIPDFFIKVLTKDYGEDKINEIIKGYEQKRNVTLRVNTIKTSSQKVKEELKQENIIFEEVSWNKEALILKHAEESKIKKLEIYQNGEIYLQSLSSMIPALVLNPKPNENILDMAAAPGGKTTQLAALTNNEAMITACEKNKIRADRLKYNLNKQRCNRVNVMLQDARKLDDFFSFDKILLDSPCSGSGTDNIFSKSFTQELVQRAVKTQEELLKKAIKILKPNGEIVYSTCSILKQENEDILNKFLNKSNIKIIPIDKEPFKEIDVLNSKIPGAICIKPNKLYEGFFIAKLKKLC